MKTIKLELNFKIREKILETYVLCHKNYFNELLKRNFFRRFGMTKRKL